MAGAEGTESIDSVEEKGCGGGGGGGEDVSDCDVGEVGGDVTGDVRPPLPGRCGGVVAGRGGGRTRGAETALAGAGPWSEEEAAKKSVSTPCAAITRPASSEDGDAIDAEEDVEEEEEEEAAESL